MLNSMDEYTRECLLIHVARKITALDLSVALFRLSAEPGTPVHLNGDNGPLFIAMALRDWMTQSGMRTLCIALGSPWKKAYCESFKSRLCEELLNKEQLDSELEAKVLTAECLRDYCEPRPHSSLGDENPAEVAKRCRTSVGVTLPSSCDCGNNLKSIQILS